MGRNVFEASRAGCKEQAMQRYGEVVSQTKETESKIALPFGGPPNMPILLEPCEQGKG